MVFAETDDGGVQVRLRRLEGRRNRFCEYATPVCDTLNKYTRYIAGEAVRYAIEVIFQRGFVLGPANGVLGIIITDKNSDVHLIDDIFKFDYSQERLHADRIFVYDKVFQGFLGGQLKENLHMCFQALIPDQNSPINYKMTTLESDIGCIEIKITRHQQMRDIEMRPEEQFVQNESTRAQYEAGETLDVVRTIERASFYVQGITHSTSLDGGRPIQLRGWDPEKAYFTSKKAWTLTFNFICRGADYLKRSKIIEHNEWRSLSRVEQAEVFAELQSFDKENALRLVMLQAGALADEESIYRKSIFNTGMVPDQYRNYSSLTVPEREVVYSLLKFRRGFLQNGRIPPYKPRDSNPAESYVEDDVQREHPIPSAKRGRRIHDPVSDSDSDPLVTKKNRLLINKEMASNQYYSSTSDDEPLMAKKKRSLINKEKGRKPYKSDSDEPLKEKMKRTRKLDVKKPCKVIDIFSDSAEEPLMQKKQQASFGVEGSKEDPTDLIGYTTPLPTRRLHSLMTPESNKKSNRGGWDWKDLV